MGAGMKIANAEVITKSLIDWLDTKYNDKTITTEVAVNTTYGTKVVDVMVSNGHAIAFEIKSELDTTKRLDSQVKGFSELFDYVYLVYWKEKFSLNELNLDENIGAIEAYWDNNKNLTFKKVKNAKINRYATPSTIAKFLWKNELNYFLHKKNITTKKSFDKSDLVNLFIQNYNKTEAVGILRFALKHRFKRGFLAYIKAKNQPNALKALIKSKTDINYIAKLEV